jgi:hypothetical protein
MLTKYPGYYQSRISQETQGDRSRLLAELWRTEGRKSIWRLLGNAWSDVRDNHTGSTDKYEFFDTVIPILPIIPADSYLQERGMELVKDDKGKLQFKTPPTAYSPSLRKKYPEETSHSAEDLVNHCYAAGLLQPSSRFRKAGKNSILNPFVVAPRARVRGRSSSPTTATTGTPHVSYLRLENSHY